MKLSLFFAGFVSAYAAIERDLVADVPCLSVEELVFDPTTCSLQSATNVVKAAFQIESCPHNLRHELLLLTESFSVGDANFRLRLLCQGKSYKPCTSWEGAGINGCDYASVFEAVNDALGECPHDVYQELMFLTSSKTTNSAKGYINSMCENAWKEVANTEFTDIDGRFDTEFMTEYFDGKTFLNNETGNFQGDNPGYETSDQSRTAGQSITDFYDGDGHHTVLTSDVQELQCRSQAMMCCFGRDRQSNDNNGDCADNDCDNKGPADNSNLCYTDFPEVIPYPQDSEGSIHCHGLAWGSDKNGLEDRFKYNNLFYVSMYDHMYKRGYVETTVPDEYVPMCGCIEDMPPVSRADCTEVEVTATFQIFQDEQGMLYVEPQDDLSIEFNACEGINYVTGESANNDLASYVNVLVRDGKMRASTQRTIFQTLVGYKAPRDNANEASCASAYKKVTGLVYPTA